LSDSSNVAMEPHPLRAFRIPYSRQGKPAQQISKQAQAPSQ
jgi:hypothetical protein